MDRKLLRLDETTAGGKKVYNFYVVDKITKFWYSETSDLTCICTVNDSNGDCLHGNHLAEIMSAILNEQEDEQP